MAILHKADFFQAQINECRHLAVHSNNQNDREFWLKMAQRCQGLLEGNSDKKKSYSSAEDLQTGTVQLNATLSEDLAAWRCWPQSFAARPSSATSPLIALLGTAEQSARLAPAGRR
jgi:hypothetical protein